MTEIQFNQLLKIFNTFQLINTKGEDTIIMAQCLTAMKNLLEEIKPSIEK